MNNTLSRTFALGSIFLFCNLAIVAMFGGCDTAESRQQVSVHIKSLAAQVKSSPESPEGKAAMDELLDILKRDSSHAKCQVCYAFGGLAAISAPVVPALMEAAQVEDRFVRQAAVKGLRDVGPPAARATNLLIEIINSHSPQDQESSLLRTLYAIEGLGNIGHVAVKAIPVLEAVSNSSDEILAERAQEAIDKLKRADQAEK